MKTSKISALLLIVIMALAMILGGCSDDDDPNPTGLPSGSLEIAGNWVGTLGGYPTTLAISDIRVDAVVTGMFTTYADIQSFDNEDNVSVVLWGVGDIDEGEFSKITWQLVSNNLSIVIYEVCETAAIALNSSSVDVTGEFVKN